MKDTQDLVILELTEEERTLGEMHHWGRFNEKTIFCTRCGAKIEDDTPSDVPVKCPKGMARLSRRREEQPDEKDPTQ